MGFDQMSANEGSMDLVGIGLALQRVNGAICIHEVIEGGPAARCPEEILEGDIICKVQFALILGS